jgi:uncharacterized membrane protein
MMGRLFWIVTALFTAVAVHIATVLYLPGFSFNRKLNAYATGQKPNSFFLMAPETQSGFMPTAAAQDIVGLCLLDLSRGKVTVNAQVPQNLWTFTVYNPSGLQIYSINDVEAGTGAFRVELTQAKSIIEQVRGRPDPEDAGKITNSGSHAEVVGDKALAVLWLPVPDASQRKSLEAVVKKTECAAG